MRIKEAAEQTGSTEKQINYLIRKGKIQTQKIELDHAPWRYLEVLSSVEDIKKARAETRVRRAKGEAIRGIGRFGESDYVTLKQIAKVVHVTPDAIRQRMYQRGWRDKAIKIGNESALPRKLADQIVMQGNKRLSKRQETSSKASRPTVVTALGNGLNTRMERIEHAVQELSTKLDTLLKMWS